MPSSRYLHPEKHDAVERVLLRGKARKNVAARKQASKPPPSQDLVTALAQQMLLERTKKGAPARYEHRTRYGTRNAGRGAYLLGLYTPNLWIRRGHSRRRRGSRFPTRHS